MYRKTLFAFFGAFALSLPACGDSGGNDTDATTSAGPTTETPSTGDTPTTGSAATCTVDICATYGAAVPQVSSDVTDQAAADPMFMADFAPLVAEGPAAVQAFKDSLTAYISDAYACSSGTYTGPDMPTAHAGLGITQAEYDAFIGLIAGVLASNGVPADDITNCFAPPLTDPAFAAMFIGK